MSKTLVTILGKGRDNPQTGYREAVYCFDDDTSEKTPFFGLALARHLHPETVIILGTEGSMWGVLIEYLAINDQENHEELRIELMEAESQGAVTQDLLNRVTPLVRKFAAENLVLRLIPKGCDEAEQIGILDVIYQAVGKKQTEIHIDITHGFRHLAAIGLLSGALIERLRSHVNVTALWYGALDMTRDNKTPVLYLNGLLSVQKWVSAMDRFDASGNYGVFAPLLVTDGLPQNKADCLEKAAFFENSIQIPNAAMSLRTLLPELDTPLRGASALFQKQLVQRLQWAKEERLSEQQRLLAHRALLRNDFLRAALLGLEALITLEVEHEGRDPRNYHDRVEVSKALHSTCKDQNGTRPEWLCVALRELSALRNSMAHGTEINSALNKSFKEPQLLWKKLEAILGRITTAQRT